MSLVHQDQGTAALQSDAELAGAAAAGVEDAFAELYRRHAQTAWRVAQSVTRNADDASDAVSEAFTRVFKSVKAGRLDEGASFRSYLLTATRNAAIDAGRKSGRIHPTDDAAVLDLRATGPTPAESIEGGADAALIAEAFRTLPERWRSVLWLTEVEGLPPREAATVLGLSANGAAQLAVRARAGLRERYLQAHVRATEDTACQFTVEHLGAYVGGALSPRDLAKVDQHLAGCESCQARREELEELGRPLRRIILPIPLALGGAAAAQWRAALAGSASTPAAAAAATGGAGRGLARPSGSWVEKAIGSAAATVLTLGVFSAAFYDSDTPQRELASPAAEAPAPSTDPDPDASADAQVALPPPSAGASPALVPPPRVLAAPPTEGDADAEPGSDDHVGGDDGPDPGGHESRDGGDGGGGNDPAEAASEPEAQVYAGGRHDTMAGSVSVGVGDDSCTGGTLGSTTAGCDDAAPPEDDGIEVSTGGTLLPETSVTLP